MHGFAVVLDTCVLYPMYLRDTLLRLAAGETYRPLWSGDILDELTRSLVERIGRGEAKHLVGIVNAEFPDAHIVGHSALISAMTNDPKDRHVLAAAVRANASGIVTFNVDDFPPAATEPFGIDVIHPDEFLVNQWDLAPRIVGSIIDEQLRGYRKPAMTRQELAERLTKSGCPRFAALLTAQ